jgi:hypothetical protein
LNQLTIPVAITFPISVKLGYRPLDRFQPSTEGQTDTARRILESKRWLIILDKRKIERRSNLQKHCYLINIRFYLF